MQLWIKKPHNLCIGHLAGRTANFANYTNYFREFIVCEVFLAGRTDETTENTEGELGVMRYLVNRLCGRGF
jgi:hypothetical protein